MEWFALGLLVAIVFGNLLVSVEVVRGIEFERRQKQLQLLLIWLFPILGALLTHYFITESERSVARDPGPFGGGAGEEITSDSIGRVDAGGGHDAAGE